MNINEYLTKQLKDGEEVVEIVRRYAGVLVPPLVGSVLLFLLDFFLLAWWFRHDGWGVLGFVFFLVLSVVWAIRAYYVWSLNILAVTTLRIIDINQRGFFERHVAEATYEKIQDVRYTIRGFWQTLFSFGTIVVQTAGATTNLELSNVRHPVEIQRLIADVQARAGGRATEPVTADELVQAVGRLKQAVGKEQFNQLLAKKQTPPKEDQT